MSISDVVEQAKDVTDTKKDIYESFDKTKNENGINVDEFFSNLLKEKNLWKQIILYWKKDTICNRWKVTI